MSEPRFDLAIIGSFGGRGPWRERAFRRIDRDDFEDALAALGARVRLGTASMATASGDAPATELEIATLDDLHPDRLIERHPTLAALRAARARAPKPEEVAQLSAIANEEDPPLRAAERSEPAGTDTLLDAVLSATETGERPPARKRDLQRRPIAISPSVEALVRAATAGSLLRGDDAAVRAWRDSVDAALAEHLRAVLRDPELRRLEAQWRGLHALVMSSETGPDLNLYLLDLDEAEIDAALQAGEGDESWLGERLCLRGEEPGGMPFSAVIAAYSFGPGPTDVDRLRRLGSLALRSGAPLIAAAEPQLVGVESALDLGRVEARARIGTGSGDRALATVRELPEAEVLALCLPRVLTRLPYGSSGESIDTFSFEELHGAGAHEQFVWGNPALAFGRVLTAAFATDPYALDLAASAEISGLPLHVVEDEDRALPCAEVVMSDAMIERVAAAGVIPVASYRDRDAVRFMRIRTLAGTPLSVRAS